MPKQTNAKDESRPSKSGRDESGIHSPSSKLVFQYKPPLLLILTMPLKRRARLVGYHKEPFSQESFFNPSGRNFH